MAAAAAVKVRVAPSRHGLGRRRRRRRRRCRPLPPTAALNPSPPVARRGAAVVAGVRSGRARGPRRCPPGAAERVGGGAAPGPRRPSLLPAPFPPPPRPARRERAREDGGPQRWRAGEEPPGRAGGRRAERAPSLASSPGRRLARLGPLRRGTGSPRASGVAPGRAPAGGLGRPRGLSRGRPGGDGSGWFGFFHRRAGGLCFSALATRLRRAAFLSERKRGGLVTLAAGTNPEAAGEASRCKSLA